MPLEREIKIRFDTADAARARILALGATPLRGRRLQEDALFDTADGALRREGCVLRLRSEAGASLLTYKGPPQPGILKLREELETRVGDGGIVVAILDALGLRITFRYEKYREEFTSEDVIIAVDETPIGTFVEIEGGEARIHETARALGCSPADYISDSYRRLFLERHPGAGPDMLFPDHADR